MLGDDSPHTYDIILPILREALHPSSSQPELLEDALCLWLVALRNAPGGLGRQQQQQEAAAVDRLFELTPALTACLTSSTGDCGAWYVCLSVGLSSCHVTSHVLLP